MARELKPGGPGMIQDNLSRQLQRHAGQAVEVADKINLVVCVAEVEVRAEGDAILGVAFDASALR